MWLNSVSKYTGNAWHRITHLNKMASLSVVTRSYFKVCSGQSHLKKTFLSDVSEAKDEDQTFSLDKDEFFTPQASTRPLRKPAKQIYLIQRSHCGARSI
jgi:hypothetical protein